MRSFKLIIFLLVLFGTCFLTTCDTPVGFGPQVPTDDPKIRIAPRGPQPGSFLSGSNNKIYITVKHDFDIETVDITVWYTDLDGMECKETIEAVWNKSVGNHVADLDTSGMEDGTIRLQVTAVDIWGKTSTTTDITYIIKNLPPQIEMTIPAIKGGTMANPGYPIGQIPDFDDPDLALLLENDPVYLGFDLMGLAEDNMGIAKGYPKIMIWPKDHPTVDADGIPTDTRYGTWRSLLVPREADGLKATKFSWPMVKLRSDSSAEGGWRLPTKEELNEGNPYLDQGLYRFRILTMDLFGKENVYPNRTDNRRADGQAADPETLSPKYIEIGYVASDIPIIMFRNIPQYYNGVGDFEVDINISSSNTLTNVEGWITQEDELGVLYTSPKYPLTKITDNGNLSQYKLTVSDSQAASWPKPSNGTLFIHMTAADSNGKESPPSYRDFTYDSTPPNVTFDRPSVAGALRMDGDLTGGRYAIYSPYISPSTSKPNWVTGTITVGGLATDGISSIDKVYYHIGKLGEENLSEPSRRAIYENPFNWEDTMLDTISPAPGWGGSVFSWAYTYNFNGFKVNGGKIQEDEEAGYPSTHPQYEDYKTQGDKSARFFVPFYIKVLDRAGNQQIIHYKLCIDPNLDDPLVTISYPYEGDTVGGEVRLSGTANDNDWVHSVLVRIKKAGEAGYYIPNTAEAFYPNPGFPIPSGGSAGWFEVKKIGEGLAIGWTYNINGDGGLNPVSPAKEVNVTIETCAIDTKDAIFHKDPGIIGPVEKVDVKFSSEVPTISTPRITKPSTADPIAGGREYFEGIQASEQFKISMVIGDNDILLGGIKDVRARINGMAYTNLISNKIVQGGLPGGWSITTPGLRNGRIECDFTIVIDSTASSYFPYGSTGNLFLEVTVVNTNSNMYTTSGAYNIGIDNFFPNTEIYTQTNASGKEFELTGRAKDYGTNSGPIQNLERVMVYFQKAEIKYSGPDYTGTRTVEGIAGQYLNQRGVAIGAADAFYGSPSTENGNFNYTAEGWATIPPMDTYMNVRDTALANGSGGPNGPNVSNFNNFPVLKKLTKTGIGEVWESPHAMVIDSQEFGSDVDLDKDGTFGEIWERSVDKSWGARMDTTLFPEGPLLVHYIVMDQAGNATHYKKDIYIANNKPIIKNINLGTDIDGDGNVSGWTSGSQGEYMRENFTVEDTQTGNSKISFNPSFNIRNNRFGIRMQTEGGNNMKHYKVSYVTNGAVISATAMTRGRVYTIMTAGTTDWVKYGAPNNYQNTTFVASGPAPNEGTPGEVRQYVYYDESTFPGCNIESDIGIGASLTFYTDLFNNFTNIGESEKTGGEITQANQNQKSFIIMVYDTTVSGLPIEDQLARAVLVAVDIDNNDDKKPDILVAPFGNEYNWNSNPVINTARSVPYNDNIVTTGSGTSLSRKGYIQYAAHTSSGTHSTAGIPDVSGKVIFSGRATDNQRIERITAEIPGYKGGGEFDIAQFKMTAGVGKIEPAISGNSISNLANDTTGTVEWGFDVVEQDLTLDFGHAVNWKFAFDSSAIATVTKLDVGIIFRVYDGRPGTLTPPGPNSSAAPPQRVDIVPYISEIGTSLSGVMSPSSSFNRSATGGYPVSCGGSSGGVINIYGFNLCGTSMTSPVATTVTVGGTALGAPQVKKARTHFEGTVGAAISSGPLVVTVNGIESINNRINRSTVRDYNLEPNNINNNVLDNSRYLYVWNTGYLLNQNVIESPFMRMSEAGNRYMSFAYYDGTTGGNGGHFIVRKNNGSATFSNDWIERSYNRYLNTTIAVAQNDQWYAAASNISAAGNPGLGFFARRQASGASGGAGNYKRNLLEIRSNSNRFRIPRIFAYNTAAIDNDTNRTRIFMSYGDDLWSTKPILFRYGLVGADNTFSGNFPGNINLGSTLRTDGTYTGGGTNIFESAQVIADNTTKYRSSIYSAVGGLEDGRALVAWFGLDSTDNTEKLFFSYSSSVPSNNSSHVSMNTGTGTSPASGTWQGNARIIPGSSGKGSHVDMAVDGGGNVHLAYYDAINGGLYYSYIPSASVASSSTAGIVTVPVDTFLAVGRKLMINVRWEVNRYVPYISYYHGAFYDSRNSIRVAWPVKFDNSGNPLAGTYKGISGYLEDSFTGNWEVMTVPVETTPVADEFICNGVPTSVDNWTSPGGTLAASPNKSILVGYMTNTWYEGAILKGNLY